MTADVQTPSQPRPPSSAIPTLSPMVIRPVTYVDTLRTLFLLFAISAVSVCAAVIAWRWFLVSPLPDEAVEVDTTVVNRALRPARQTPPRIVLEVTYGEPRPAAVEAARPPAK